MNNPNEETVNNPEDETMGVREIPFSREVYIEQGDFMEDPPGKYFRLAPGREVRLKSAYIIKCEEVIKYDSGRITEVHCSYDPETRSGGPQSNRKVKGTLHWVSARHAAEAEIRLYDRLFNTEVPDEAPLLAGDTEFDLGNQETRMALLPDREDVERERQDRDLPDVEDDRPGDDLVVEVDLHPVGD